MLRTTSFLAVCLGLTAAIQADPIYLGENDHYYEAIGVGGLTWDDAKLAAEAQSYLGVSGHLVTLTSALENDFVVNAFGGPVAINHYWLGGYQAPGNQEPGGGWQWVTEEIWDYTNWYPGEPNDESGEGSLVFWGDTGTWNDWDREYGSAGYIVEYAVPEPSSLVLVVMGSVAIAVFGRPANRRLGRASANEGEDRGQRIEDRGQAC